jgi:hypothetical protein
MFAFAGFYMISVYYDMMPDYTVSVYLDGHWDFFKSYSDLASYCDSNFLDYELVDISETSYQQRIELGLIDE